MRIERCTCLITWLVRWVWLSCLCVVMGAAQGQSIESVLAPGEVVSSHAKVENECASCHVRFNPKGQDALCMACHKPVGQDVKARQGFHGRLKADATCRSCHTDHKGRGAKIVQFDAKRFDHLQTDYKLVAKHQDVACDKCHASGKKYAQAPAECAACHKKDDVHKGGISGKCSDCHRETGWKDTTFDHGKKTKFALEDKHAKVKCDDCHSNGRYKDTTTTCMGCHKKSDEHKGLYGTKCETCHTAKAWKDVTFNHDVDTSYVLRGKHRKTACSDCHTGPLYKQKLTQQCWDCHKKDDKHKESLGKDCAACHTESNWKEPPRFDHDKTSFPLLGRHTKVECKDCHKSVMFKEATSDCYGCHQKDDKHAGTLGRSCVDCHTERDWRATSGRFDHDRTRFPLRNAHAASKVVCSDCHTGGIKNFKAVSNTCYACHKKDDKHEGSLGQQCDQCHTDKNWKSASVDHGKTRFPLTGAHKAVACQDCHASKRFNEAPRECVACHQKADVHKSKLGTRCESCHNTRHWKAWEFNHDKQTRYPLVGAHVRVKCDACHTQKAPAGKPIAETGSRCFDCHGRDDPHDGQFGPRCEQCHVSTKWLQLDKHFSKP